MAKGRKKDQSHQETKETGQDENETGDADIQIGTDNTSPNLSQRSKSTGSQGKDNQSGEQALERLAKLEKQYAALQKLQDKESCRRKERKSIGDPKTIADERIRQLSKQQRMNKLFAIRLGDPMHLTLKCNKLKYQGTTYLKGNRIPTALANDYVNTGKNKPGKPKSHAGDEANVANPRIIVKGVLPGNGNNQQSDPSEPSMSSAMTTDTEKTSSTDQDESQSSAKERRRLPPAVKFGPNWIMRVEHLEGHERTRGAEARDLSDQQMDVMLFSQERLSNEQAIWQRTKRKFAADFKSYKQLTYSTFRNILTQYIKHINKGKQHVEIDVYMWTDLTDEFKSDFRNKYRNHCSVVRAPDVAFRNALGHLEKYPKVPEDLEFETMLGQDMLVLMYISLLPTYTSGQRIPSFNAAITDMIGDEISLFNQKYKANFSNVRLLENYQLVVEGLTLCLSEIRKHLYIQEWYLNHTYPVQTRKDAGSRQKGLAQILYDEFSHYGFKNEWDRQVTRAFSGYIRTPRIGEDYTVKVLEQFIQTAHELAPATSNLRDMNRYDNHVPSSERFDKTHVTKANPKASKSPRDTMHNMQTIEGESPVESSSENESNGDACEEENQLLDTTVNNLNAYLKVPERKPITVNQAKPVQPKATNWSTEPSALADKLCYTYTITGSCNKGNCPFNHTPKLRELAIDKLVRERATSGGNTAATALHNMCLYSQVMDRPLSQEEYHELDNFNQSQTETSDDVDA